MATMMMDSVSRYFVQMLLRDKLVSETKAIGLYIQISKELLQKDMNPSEFIEFVANINKELRTLDLELASTKCPETGTRHWAIINTNGDEIAQLATDYTPNEISYLKLIIEHIVKSPNGAFELSTIEALNLNESSKRNDTEDLLRDFEQHKWICTNNKGKLSLGMRLLLELKGYLKNEFPDEMKDCCLCSDLITTGHFCSQSNCYSKMHLYCEQRYFNQRNDPFCPNCNSRWVPVSYREPQSDEDTEASPHTTTIQSVVGLTERN